MLKAFFRTPGSLFGANTKGFKVDILTTNTQGQSEPAFGGLVDDCTIFSQTNRMVERCPGNAYANLNSRGARTYKTGHKHRIG